MREANISRIQAHFREYIEYAKAGEDVVILDRDRPVAKIVGIRSGTAIQIREPSIDLAALLLVNDKRQFDEKIDIADILSRDREDRN